MGVSAAQDLTTTAAGTSFGATTVGGNLGVTASGAVADTGKLDITGTTGITATGQTVTLDDSTNEFGGTVTVSAGATTLKDADSLVAVLNTTGTTDLTAVGTLGVSGSATGDLTTTAAGTSFGATTVGGNLGVTASGAVADTGKLDITGTTGITATGQTVTLDDSTNEFGGTVTVAAGATILKDADSLVAVLNTTGTTDLTAVGTLGVSGSATGDLTTTAAGTSFGATTVGGNLGVTASGAVADTGKLDITGTTGITATGQTVTLDDSTNEFGGTVTVSAGATTLKDADSLVAVLNTTGTTDLTAVGTLGVSGSATGDLTTTAAGTSFGATTVGGNLGVTASGAVADTGKLDITGTTGITATGQTVTLDDSTNEFGGTVTVSAGATTLKDADSLVAVLNTTGTTDLTAVGTLGVSGSATGDLTTTAAGTSFGATTVGGNLGVTASGAVADTGKLDIAGTTTISAIGQKITLDDETSTYGDFTITADEVYVADAGSLTASSIQANMVQLKGGSGVSVSSTGVAKFAAESDDGDISITNTGGYEISTLSDINGVRFTDSDATGTITLIANSPLSIMAPVDAGKGALQLTAAGSEATDDITIKAAISGNSISLDAGDSVALTAGEVISNVLNLNAVQDVLIDVPVTSPQADIVAGGGINLDQHADISSSTMNLTSESMTIDKAASVPVFSFSIGGEGGLSFDSDGRVQQATQSEWNSYFRASETVQISYKSAGSVILDQLVLSNIPNEVLAKNTGKIEFEEEE